jgi:hypothetical protein
MVRSETEGTEGGFVETWQDRLAGLEASELRRRPCAAEHGYVQRPRRKHDTQISNTILRYEETFDSFLKPREILVARCFKFSAQFDI